MTCVLEPGTAPDELEKIFDRVENDSGFIPVEDDEDLAYVSRNLLRYGVDFSVHDSVSAYCAVRVYDEDVMG